jgi:fatty acid desaturase
MGKMNFDKSKLTPAIKEKILNYQKPESWRWVLTCICNWLVVFACFYVAYDYQSLWVDALVVIVVGNRQHAIALLGHEGSHYTLSSNRQWNDFLTGILTLWPLGVSLPGYREFHFKHHQNVGTTDDPELDHKRAFAPGYDLPITRSKIIFYFFKDMLCLSSNEVLLAMKFFTPKNKVHLLIPFLLMGSIASTLIYFGFFWVVILWFIAIYTSFWAFFRIRIYIEHVGTNETHRVEANPLLNLIFFPHGSDAHWEHHQWPNMLYYHRQKIRALILEPRIIKINDLLKSYENKNHIQLAPVNTEANFDELLIH